MSTTPSLEELVDALAMYGRPHIMLRDVLFLCHAKPADVKQEALWKKLVDGKLETPDTWEVQLSGGADKKETFERLMMEGKLGALAFLRNLRNMKEAGVDRTLVGFYANAKPYDRLVILTDEQSYDVVGNPKGNGYMINVAAHQNGVGYGPWTHIDGWSEAVIDYIIEAEKQ